ncbi:lamin tail domain-containing protein [Solirubrobacter taibaiensis]|nr:lamin tail domain-containing protein [Solirubrobacter taibaiensis]
MSPRTLLGAVALLLATAAPAQAAVVINEVSSTGTDFIELTNTGAVEVDIGGYRLKDNDDGRTFAIPAGIKLAPGGFYAANVGSGPGNFGLGDADSARVYLPGGVTLLDSHTWTAPSSTTFGRCPDGTGAITQTERPTPGAANDCFSPLTAWPGGVSVVTGDVAGTYTNNMSGLAYQPSGTAQPGTLWAVRNASGGIESGLYRLTYDGTNWRDTVGWAGGKQLFYPTGAGRPDTEGVTLVDGEPNAVYAAVERDLAGGGSAPKVLRFDVSSPNPTLSATHEWALTGLPALGDNTGPEAIAWIPDDVLVKKGFVDEVTNAKYNPASYPNHGAGLFFVGIEQDASIVAYALTPGVAAAKVATIDSGFLSVMDLEYEPASRLLWAACDDTCIGRTATLDVAASGRFAVTNVYERPAGMDNFNNEGFAIAPNAECANNVKPAFWLDDTNALGTALRVGTIRCPVPVVDPVATPDATASPQPTVAPTPVPTTPAADRTAPKVRLSLTKPATKGTYAVRKTGKLKLTITLDERADLTIKVSARKSSRAKLRTLTTTTRKGVPAGKPSYTLTLSSKVRKALKKGEKLTIAVQARDAAGNVGTGSASGTVR